MNSHAPDFFGTNDVVSSITRRATKKNSSMLEASHISMCRIKPVRSVDFLQYLNDAFRSYRMDDGRIMTAVEFYLIAAQHHPIICSPAATYKEDR